MDIQTIINNANQSWLSTNPINKKLTDEQRKALILSRFYLFRLFNKNQLDFMWEDGKCWLCKYDLVLHYGVSYILEPITGCPSCHTSYCE